MLSNSVVKCMSNPLISFSSVALRCGDTQSKSHLIYQATIIS
jgi:hypothetical protein